MKFVISKKNTGNNRGFTLLETLVAIAIIVIAITAPLEHRIPEP